MKTKLLIGLFTILFGGVILAACSSNEATTTASCAFITGDGEKGHDAKLHDVLYPGEAVHRDNSEDISWVPCNSRNYIINDGSVRNANGDKVGDRDTPIVATTKTGVTIHISATAYWTLNESEASMRNFYAVCFKYSCANGEDVGGGSNFSTPGWNGMLAENFGPAMDKAARLAAIEADDSIWQTHDPDQYQALADKMSAVFSGVIQANFGYTEDLFCGSGNSVWSDPNKPGEGTFSCTPVRVDITDIQVVSGQSSQSSEGAIEINKQRKASAEVLYGDFAGYWLGLQDSIALCKAQGITCIFNIGDTGSPAIPVPTATHE